MRELYKHYYQFQRQQEEQTHLLIKNIEMNVKVEAKPGRGMSVGILQDSSESAVNRQEDFESLSVTHDL